jgi:hypothetical protein
VQRQERIRHDLGNLLGIALANVEAMIDGIAPPTTARLETIANSLRRAREALLALREDHEE